MSIINQLYSKIIKNSIENAIRTKISFNTINHYLDFINYLDGFLLEIVKKSIQDTFETIDCEFKNSPRRKALYYTKGAHRRTIMTLFGEVSFEREYYVPKNRNTDGFFYIDNLFSLPKRDYYDPMIKAYIVQYSAKYSYIQSGELMGDKIGSRYKTLAEQAMSTISRQTVYNVLKHADVGVVVEETKEDVETLYIQMDEKWAHTQGNGHQMKEIKAAVIYTDIEEEYHGRNKLINRHVITSDQSASDLKRKLLDYIIQTYNVDTLRNIVLSGDGAKWIQMSTLDLSFEKTATATFILDRFHMHQAINHISKDPTIKHYLREYLKLPRTKSFHHLCDALIVEYPHRREIIAKYRDYLLSNWTYIKRQNNPLFKGCSMEGHISHVLAALFTSRPKAHSLHMITKRLQIRELFVNGLDIKNVYLSNHVSTVPEVDYVELITIYPTTTFDVVGYKVTEKYKAYKRIAHPSYS
jgi:hypothetical protein